MILAALVVGLVTAYYLGVRAGVTAAAAAGGLFLVAAIVPALSTIAYLAVGAGVAGVCVIGPRRERPPSSRRALLWLRMSAQRYLGKKPNRPGRN